MGLSDLVMQSRALYVSGASLAASLVLAGGSLFSEGWSSKVMALSSTGFASGSAVAALVANRRMTKRFSQIVSVEDEILKIRAEAVDTLSRLRSETEEGLRGRKEEAENDLRNKAVKADRELQWTIEQTQLRVNAAEEKLHQSQNEEREILTKIKLLHQQTAKSEETVRLSDEKARRATERMNATFDKAEKERAAQIRKSDRLKKDIEALQTTLDNAETLIASGFGPRRYPDLRSNSLEKKLTKNRDNQKKIASNILKACSKSNSWTIDGSITKGRASLKRGATAFLRGFNGECDAAISTLKYNNDSTVINKINRAYSFYEKKAEMEKIPWDPEILSLREEEAYLVHENHLQKQLEKEEQAEIRQQMREEEKALREMEEATKRAQEEATKYAKMLANAQKEAAISGKEISDKQRRKIEELERLLQEASDNKERAISRAQLTRSGHVYIISNIGSFGENVYKVGMTRRLEPMDRVRELGDASVPFPFDVHAMIFTDDAPALENTIHKQIEIHRLNRINPRREFFTITIDELKAAVDKASKNAQIRYSIHWTKFAEADQYRQSVKEREVVAA